MATLQCYNKGCSQKYDPADSDKDLCQYHPGPHEFHDAYKIWKCCQKKSTDFTTWLNYPGCKKGKHSNVKPDENVKVTTTQEIRPEKEDEVIVWNGLNKPTERSRATGKLEALNVEVTAGAAAAVEKQRNAAAEASGNGEVVIGAACKNNSCQVTYNGPETNKTDCIHHPGVAIFHEGVKYWSCCQKKTSDFNAFLNQVGCTSGQHAWSKNERVDKIREDWFSRAGYIHLNIYCKGALPDKCTFDTDGLLLRTVVVHGFGNKITENSYNLFGAIVPSESKVIIGERKIEMVLKQAEATGWPSLIYTPPAEEETPVSEVDSAESVA